MERSRKATRGLHHSRRVQNAMYLVPPHSADLPEKSRFPTRQDERVLEKSRWAGGTLLR